MKVNSADLNICNTKAKIINHIKFKLDQTIKPGHEPGCQLGRAVLLPRQGLRGRGRLQREDGLLD